MTLFLEPSPSPDAAPRGATVPTPDCVRLSETAHKGEQNLNNLPESPYLLAILIEMTEHQMRDARTKRAENHWRRKLARLVES